MFYLLFVFILCSFHSFFHWLIHFSHSFAYLFRYLHSSRFCFSKNSKWAIWLVAREKLNGNGAHKDEKEFFNVIECFDKFIFIITVFLPFCGPMAGDDYTADDISLCFFSFHSISCHLPSSRLIVYFRFQQSKYTVVTAVLFSLLHSIWLQTITQFS